MSRVTSRSQGVLFPMPYVLNFILDNLRRAVQGEPVQIGFWAGCSISIILGLIC